MEGAFYGRIQTRCTLSHMPTRAARQVTELVSKGIILRLRHQAIIRRHPFLNHIGRPTPMILARPQTCVWAGQPCAFAEPEFVNHIHRARVRQSTVMLWNNSEVSVMSCVGGNSVRGAPSSASAICSPSTPSASSPRAAARWQSPSDTASHCTPRARTAGGSRHTTLAEQPVHCSART